MAEGKEFKRGEDAAWPLVPANSRVGREGGRTREVRAWGAPGNKEQQRGQTAGEEFGGHGGLISRRAGSIEKLVANADRPRFWP
jgi:hypothetical protein